MMRWQRVNAQGGADGRSQVDPPQTDSGIFHYPAPFPSVTAIIAGSSRSSTSLQIEMYRVSTFFISNYRPSPRNEEDLPDGREKISRGFAARVVQRSGGVTIVTRLQVTAEESAHVLEIYDGETAVSRLRVIPYRQRIGAAWVRMGGIAGVGTPTQSRMKGYARELLKNTVEWMTDAGYHWSGLFGIPDFYHRFGYVTALPESRLTIPTRYAEVARPYHNVRSWQETDTPAALAIYAVANAERTGVVERVPGTWTGFRRSTNWSAIPAVAVAQDQTGQAVGYAVYDKYSDGVMVAEIAALTMAGYESLLHHLAQQAVERRSESITFHVAPDHSVARLGQQLGCSYTVTYPLRRAGMWRLLNQTALFHAIEAELVQRLARAGWRPKMSLTLTTELGSTTLTFDGQQLHTAAGTAMATAAPLAPAPSAALMSNEFHIQVSQMALTQALMGYVPLRETLERAPGDSAASQLPAVLAELCDILFPRQFAMLWLPDHF